MKAGATIWIGPVQVPTVIDSLARWPGKTESASNLSRQLGVVTAQSNAAAHDTPLSCAALLKASLIVQPHNTTRSRDSSPRVLCTS